MIGKSDDYGRGGKKGVPVAAYLTLGPANFPLTVAVTIVELPPFCYFFPIIVGYYYYCAMWLNSWCVLSEFDFVVVDVFF